MTLKLPSHPSASARSGHHSPNFHSWDLLATPKSEETGLVCVQSVTFSADGKRFVTASTGSGVDIWDAKTYEHVKMLVPRNPVPETALVSAVAISPDSRRVVAGYRNIPGHVVRMWNISSGKELETGTIGLKKDDETAHVTSLAFSPDGTSVASGSDHGKVVIWDLSTNVLVQKRVVSHLSDSNRVHSLSYSRDSSKLALATEGGNFTIWNMKTDPPICERLRDSPAVWSAALWPRSSAHDFAVAVGTFANTTLLYQSLRDDPLRSQLLSTKESLSVLAFSSDGRRLVIGMDNGDVIVRDVASGTLIGGSMKGHRGCVMSVTFSPDGKRIVSGSEDNVICVWNWEKIGTALNPNQLSPASSPKALGFILHKDGWLRDPDENLVLWIPPGIRNSLDIKGELIQVITVREPCQLNLEYLLYGKRWIDGQDKDCEWNNNQP